MKDKGLEYGVNKEQYETLDISKNIAVRAGAGSGKTRVLSKRYLRLLMEVPDINIKNIVAITFTEKAALEMKERIRNAVIQEMKKETNAQKKQGLEHIRDSITLANISTIHGFCSKLIRENFYHLGVDPYFKVIEEYDRETNLRRLVEEAIDYIFSKEEISDEVNTLLEMYTSNAIIGGELANSILEMYNKIREKGLNITEAYRLTSLTNKLDFLNRSKIENVESIIVPLNIVEILAHQIIKKLDAEYKRFKNENNLLDFNDLELLTDKLLEDEKVRERYRNIYRFILVDEAQDINELQKRIIYKLAVDANGNIQPGKLFIVGDHKQSIYGFRGTDYKIFDRICQDVGEKGEVKLLSNCYRSTSQIINTINSLFSKLIEPYEALKVPDDREIKNGGRTELILLEKPVEDSSQNKAWDEVKSLLKDDGKQEELKRSLLELGRVEKLKVENDNIQSLVIAKRIEKLLDQGFNYKDIAILLRSRTHLSSIENFLRKHKIPYSVLGGIGFWGRQEIIDIINLYRFIVNSDDLTSLAGALRSPIFSFDDKLLFEFFSFLRDQKEKGIVESLHELTSRCNAMDIEIIQRAHNILTKLKRLKGFLSAHELLYHISEITCYKQILLTQVNGFQKYRNFEKLMTIAKEFDEKKLYKAREFVTYLDVLEKHSFMEEEALLDTEDSNAVKILTIHSSKGLEFKAVILPDMSKELDWKAKRDKSLFIFSEDYGITAIFSSGGERSVEGNPLYNMYYNKELEREIEDSKRIFYVAATRAEEFLAFIGEDQEYVDRKGNIKLNTFMRQLKYAMYMNDGNVEGLATIEGSTFIAEKTITKEIMIEDIDNLLNEINGCDEVKPEYEKRIMQYDSPVSGMFSVSQYLKYLDCPRKYFYEYRAKLMVETLEDTNGIGISIKDNQINEALENTYKISAAEKGKIIHKVLEEMRLKGISDKSEAYSQLATVVTDYAANFKKEQLEGFINDGRRFIDNYLKIEKELKNLLRGNKLKSFVELGFRIPVTQGSRIMINGIIDRLDVYEEGEFVDLCIIDYKTNVIRKSEDIEDRVNYYRPQMMIYSKAVRDLIKFNGKKLRSVCAYLYFLDYGEFRKLEFTQKELDILKRDMLDKINRAFRFSGLEDFECNKGKSCTLCVYSSLCL
ncbi:MAG: UvrD-helicase domain-containing protein [Clostridiaceae bacterium]|jgi:ATP-dependent helicase/nuclease subunit A|nr:UvrD-helicase domain-containing protein [Clostridiaceae bacterium]